MYTAQESYESYLFEITLFDFHIAMKNDICVLCLLEQNTVYYDHIGTKFLLFLFVFKITFITKYHLVVNSFRRIQSKSKSILKI